LTKSFLGRELVAFRTAAGRVAVLEARCSHLGADLGRGRVVGEAIQCPYHNWEYGPDGRCVNIPAQRDIPVFACQTSYPVEERHGYVFFFSGREPLFPLPLFEDCRAEDLAASKAMRFFADCPWQMFSANAFDAQHWTAMHNRKVLGAHVIDTPHPYAHRIRFRARVTGMSIFDRLLRRFAGNTVEVNITNHGGTFIVVTGFFRRARSRMILATLPLGPGRMLQVDTIVFVQRSRFAIVRALIQPLSLWLRRWFTRAFMAHEFYELAGIHYSPHTLIKADQDLVNYFRWAASLPGTRPTGMSPAPGQGRAWAGKPQSQRPLPLR
jgi:nitrite reductase/ring-hydroxylating ferredoxin subunit